jgi:hypothetical protein
VIKDAGKKLKERGSYRRERKYSMMMNLDDHK